MNSAQPLLLSFDGKEPFMHFIFCTPFGWPKLPAGSSSVAPESPIWDFVQHLIAVTCGRPGLEHLKNFSSREDPFFTV
jgi:hypothetical protein